MAAKSDGRIELEVGDRVVKISNPDRVYFSARGETKLDLANYYLSVADGIVNALYHRPCMLHRFPDGMRPNERLPQAIITPTTKAADGAHDAPLTADAILDQGLLTPAQWRTTPATCRPRWA